MNWRDREKKTEMNSAFSPRRAFAALVIIHLLIALPLAYFLNIWVDEASTLHTTERGFFDALQNALRDEKQAPFYFWILSLWREISDSIFFARLFSIFCSILAIKFFYDLARKFFDEKSAVLIAAFFALHPYLIWASLEIRVYSLVVLLSVLLIKFFYEGYFESQEIPKSSARRSPQKAQIFYVLISIVALYTNYYLGFALVGCFVALLVVRRWSAAKIYFLQMLLIGAAFAPLLWAVGEQFAANTSGFQAEKTLFGGWQIFWSFLLTFVLPTEIFPPEEATAVSIFRLWLVRVLILIAAVLLIKNRRRLNEKFFVIGSIVFVIYAFLLAAYFLLGAIYVEIRHAAVLFAPLVLFAGLVIKTIFVNEANGETDSSNRKNVTAFVSVCVAAFFVYSIYSLYPNLTKRGDWARVGAFIERNEKPHQPIIVFTAFDALALPYHYRGANKILPDEKFFEWEFEDAIGSANSWRRQTEYIISEIPPQANEIWLLTNEKCLRGQACEPLENFVRANYTVIVEKDFYTEKVRLLRKKQND